MRWDTGKKISRNRLLINLRFAFPLENRTKSVFPSIFQTPLICFGVNLGLFITAGLAGHVTGPAERALAQRRTLSLVPCKQHKALEDFIIISLEHLLALSELRPLAASVCAFIHVPSLCRLNDSRLIIYGKESSLNVFTQFATPGGGCQPVSACVIAWDI